MPEPQLLKKIKDCDYDFDDDVWDHVSPIAKNLIRGLIQLDPDKRISLDTYLASPWIQGEGVKDKPLKIVVERLSKFNDARRKFRALVLAKLVAGKFRASISRERTPNSVSVHRLWTGTTGSPPEVSRTDIGNRSPLSGPGSPGSTNMLRPGESTETTVLLPNQTNVEIFSLTPSTTARGSIEKKRNDVEPDG
jgi:serine/threonine protein kinase